MVIIDFFWIDLPGDSDPEFGDRPISRKNIVLLILKLNCFKHVEL